MKKVLKAAGVIVLAAVMAVGGYFVGQKAQISSISSALPRNTLTRPEETATAAPQINSAAEETAPAPTAAQPPKDAIQTERNIIEKNSQTASAATPTVVTSADIMLGGEKTEVKLYTSADKDTDGSFIWDDGNQWVLEVKKDGGYYTLINKYVQLGKISLMAGEDENGEGVITAVVSTGTGLSVEKYTYNGTAFEGQTVYNSGVLNVKGSTF